MAIPDFLRDLRQIIGHRMIVLPGVNAVVFDDRRRVLLVRRSDDGRWTLVSGIPEPGEQPAAAMVREIYEETAVHAVPERVVSLHAEEEVTVYPHGDEVYFTTMTFRCRAVGGQARVNDDESTEVGWFALDELPPLGDRSRALIDRALVDDAPTWFAAPAAPAVPPVAPAVPPVAPAVPPVGDVPADLSADR